MVPLKSWPFALNIRSIFGLKALRTAEAFVPQRLISGREGDGAIANDFSYIIYCHNIRVNEGCVSLRSRDERNPCRPGRQTVSHVSWNHFSESGLIKKHLRIHGSHAVTTCVLSSVNQLDSGAEAGDRSKVI